LEKEILNVKRSPAAAGKLWLYFAEGFAHCFCAVVGAVVHVNLMRCAAAGAVVVHTVFYITANSVDYVFFHHGASPFLVRHKSVCFCVLYQYGQNTPEYTAGGAYGNFCGW
jgi:hypothetical protein